MTLNELLSSLKDANPASPIHLKLPTRQITSGYNVTELTLSQVSSLDCVGQPHSWREATAQVMVTGGDGLTAQALLGIGKKTQSKLDGIADANLSIDVDLGTREAGLVRYNVGSAQQNDPAFEITLSARRAACKASKQFEAMAILPKKTKLPTAKSVVQNLVRYSAKKLLAISALFALKPIVFPNGTACC